MYGAIALIKNKNKNKNVFKILLKINEYGTWTSNIIAQNKSKAKNLWELVSFYIDVDKALHFCLDGGRGWPGQTHASLSFHTGALVSYRSDPADRLKSTVLLWWRQSGLCFWDCLQKPKLAGWGEDVQLGTWETSGPVSADRTHQQRAAHAVAYRGGQEESSPTDAWPAKPRRQLPPQCSGNGFRFLSRLPTFLVELLISQRWIWFWSMIFFSLSTTSPKSDHYVPLAGFEAGSCHLRKITRNINSAAGRNRQ